MDDETVRKLQEQGIKGGIGLAGGLAAGYLGQGGPVAPTAVRNITALGQQVGYASGVALQAGATAGGVLMAGATAGQGAVIATAVAAKAAIVAGAAAAGTAAVAAAPFVAIAAVGYGLYRLFRD